MNSTVFEPMDMATAETLLKEAKQILDLGAMISFTGVVTYKNAAEVVAAAKLVPICEICEVDAN